MSAAIPAAIATPPRGEIRMIHSVRHQELLGEVAAALYSTRPSTSTFSMRRFSNDGCACSGARSEAATRSANAASFTCALSS